MELILSICLLASPGICKEEMLPFDNKQALLPSRCIMEAPIAIAEWSETHPKWKVTKWRCDRPDAGGRGI